MSAAGAPVERAPVARFVAATQVADAFRNAQNVDWQRLRSEQNELVDQDVTPRCFQADSKR